jgi:hypothetical protein
MRSFQSLETNYKINSARQLRKMTVDAIDQTALMDE